MEHGDIIAVSTLTVLSIVLFAAPAIAGHPPIVADNLIQNFPLRVLSGKIFATGFLPTWNTLANSGTPLLGGLNAGVMYPLTWPFAILPGVLAWVINMAACYIAAGVGLYVLARWLGLAKVASFLGAVTYAFMGMMIAQMVHLGVIEGQGWLPWVVLTMLIVTRRIRSLEPDSPKSRLCRQICWPFAWLVILIGMVFLTGEPRAIADLEIVGAVTGVYCIGWADRDRGRPRRWLVAGVLVLGVTWGVLLSAIQLLPGQSFIGISQRAAINQSFFGSGSYSLNRTLQLVVPYFFGGAGVFHQPVYFLDYNLPEVTGYVGLIGLVALFSAGTQFFGSARRKRPHWLGLFVALAGIGLVFAWGQFTPLIHVMAQIPLLNKTRLQSRNLAIFDLAVSVLVAWFAHQVLTNSSGVSFFQGWRRWVSLTPLFVGIAVLLGALIWPVGSEELFGANANVAIEGHFLMGWFLGSLVLMIATLLFLLRCSRWRPDYRRAGIVTIVVIDAAFFMVGNTTGLISTQNPEPSRQHAVSIMGSQGRYALIDPNLIHEVELVALGQPNTNVFTQLPSVQGYGSLIGSTYGIATNAHAQNDLDPCAVIAGTFQQLRLGTLVVANDALAPLISSSTSVPAPYSPSPACTSQPPASAYVSRPVYFGASLTLQSIAVKTAHPISNNTTLHVTILGPLGQRENVTTIIVQTPTGLSINFPSHPVSLGLAIDGLTHSDLVASTVTDTEMNVYALNGEFQNAVDLSSWKLTPQSPSPTMQVFQSAAPLTPPLSFEGGSGSAVLVSSSTTLRGSETDIVKLSTQTTVVRSEAYLPGWKATISPLEGGTSRSVTVSPHSLVQQATLPAGSWTLTWTYHPPHLLLGAAVSGAASLGLVVVAAWGILWSFRRRASNGSGGR